MGEDIVGLTEAEREAIVCDCAVALATDACPIHADDESLWTEQPASHILTAVERIVAARVRKAEQRGAVQALRDAADEMWRIFLRLPHAPSPLGDYIQRRMIEFRARANRLAGEQP